MARRSDEERHHGKKRPAESDPDGTQPLAKKFGRLHIDNVPSTDVGASHCEALAYNGVQPGDAMMLDDTKNTTYIHNLDQELAEADVLEDGLVFLPALTAKMMSIPESVLSTSHSDSSGKELVLYTEPSSLTVPLAQDSVRKAIIESRARARAEKKPSSNSDHASSMLPGKELNTTGEYCSGDLMDID